MKSRAKKVLVTYTHTYASGFSLTCFYFPVVWGVACFSISSLSLCKSFREVVFLGWAVFPESVELHFSSSVSANTNQLTGGWFVVFPFSAVFHPVEKRCGIADFAIDHDDSGATCSCSSALSVARKLSHVDASVGILDDWVGGGGSLVFVVGVHCFRSWWVLFRSAASYKRGTIHFNFLIYQWEIEIPAKYHCGTVSLGNLEEDIVCARSISFSDGGKSSIYRKSRNEWQIKKWVMKKKVVL